MQSFLILLVIYCRFHVNLLGQTQSELVWMRNPGQLENNGNGWSGWEQFVLITDGPDAFFTMHTLSNQDKDYSVLVTGQLNFFTENWHD
jgi:hypothetical protein